MYSSKQAKLLVNKEYAEARHPGLIPPFYKASVMLA